MSKVLDRRSNPALSRIDCARAETVWCSVSTSQCSATVMFIDLS
jgi:hypothetical protein